MAGITTSELPGTCPQQSGPGPARREGRSYRRRVAYAAAGALVLSLLGASSPAAFGADGATSASASAVNHIYVGGVLSNNLAAVNVTDDEGAAPQRVPGSPFASGYGAFVVAASPNGRFLYTVPNIDAGEILVYAVADNGQLTRVQTTKILIPGNATTMGLSFSPDGRHMYATSGTGFFDKGGIVTTYTVADNGIPSQTGQPVNIGASSGLMMSTVSADGRNLYVSDYRQGQIVRLALGSDGTPSAPLERVPTGAGPCFPTISPDGKHFYNVNELGGNVSGFSIAADGSLTPVSGSPFAAGSTPHSVTITPDNRYMYVPNVLSHTIDGYEVQANGALTKLGNSPFPSGADGDSPARTFLSPDGKHLYAVDIASGAAPHTAKLHTFTIGADGRLTESAPAYDTGITGADGPSSVLVPGH
ncbi:beta-propeller fold lactonase family protein [Streptomyces rubradiris]|uniref:lactonase family protein n=1 Tax=Streptomyces rubradiris TaxID=285531 RepID=UPI0033F0CFC3